MCSASGRGPSLDSGLDPWVACCWSGIVFNPQVHGGDGGGRTVHQLDAPGDKLGDFAVGGQRRQMLLPKVEVASRQFVDVRLVVRIGHGKNYAAFFLCNAAFSAERFYDTWTYSISRGEEQLRLFRHNRWKLRTMADKKATEEAPITIKKYANRRLYNTATSSYVTLDHLAQMVKDGTDFVVFDAKSGDDITRSVLTHIIVEEESKGQNLLPINFLRHLISFYGDSLQSLVPRYLDLSMGSFARNQEQMRHYMRDTLDGLMPFQQFEEMGKQNMELFEDAMKMFTPFYGAAEQDSSEDEKPETGQDLDALREQLETMQKQLNAMKGKKG